MSNTRVKQRYEREIIADKSPEFERWFKYACYPRPMKGETDQEFHAWIVPKQSAIDVGNAKSEIAVRNADTKSDIAIERLFNGTHGPVIHAPRNPFSTLGSEEFRGAKRVRVEWPNANGKCKSDGSPVIEHWDGRLTYRWRVGFECVSEKGARKCKSFVKDAIEYIRYSPILKCDVIRLKGID